MEIKLDRSQNDSYEFVSLLETIINGVINDVQPGIIFLIKIDNWFSFKWLNFSGVIDLQLGVWKGQITIPPFNPNRILSQFTYKKEEGYGYKQIEAPMIHIRQESMENLKNTLPKYADSGVFVWWSGNSDYNKKGSMMLYTHKQKQSSSWYASFEKKENWLIYKTNGISKKELQKYI